MYKQTNISMPIGRPSGPCPAVGQLLRYTQHIHQQ